MEDKFTHWALDYENKVVFPHSNEGNEVYAFEFGEAKEIRITIWCDLSEDIDTYPNLTIEQAKRLHWALGKAIKEATQHEKDTDGGS